MLNMQTISAVVFYWRLCWYFILLVISIKHKAYIDIFAAIILLFLAGVVIRSQVPLNNGAAFIVAPLLTGLLVRYQSETKELRDLARMFKHEKKDSQFKDHK